MPGVMNLIRGPFVGWPAGKGESLRELTRRNANFTRAGPELQTGKVSQSGLTSAATGFVAARFSL